MTAHIDSVAAAPGFAAAPLLWPLISVQVAAGKGTAGGRALQKLAAGGVHRRGLR